ncbi:hypothetical protein Afil01_12400 [Actinorhabdospora filicis]|uniref:DUF501 domain-containing protein n=1 Tax=Actinorhabdospora filicis TaxID=1785913 RepID=A0A9W6W7Z2_9ACTN|nr:DUF501 domain-containing protein [Actinorhabdospora filicis]GLZ76433.1 hypothetical protein Afil01_12400 [Actinorhabdospora filicis]
MTFSETDREAVKQQLGREPRDVHDVAHRCPCGNPDVVTTPPRLSDGTPFPTTYYLTCPKAAGAVGGLEAAGVMKGMQERLAEDPELKRQYERAHEDYLERRRALGEVPEIDGISAGGMPDRVKCLHVHLGHSLAVGRGVNPFGDETRDLVGEWWANGPCVREADEA